MCKKIVIALLLLLPFAVKAQRHEIGILGGVKSDGGWTGSAAYYFKFRNIQVGPVVEVSNVPTKYIFTTFTTDAYNAISPGINLNYQYKIPRGYIYPGVTARYRIGTGALEYRGLDMGLQLGGVFRLVKFLSLNAETGFRLDNITIYNLSGNELGKTSDVRIPVMIGVRFAL